MLYARNKMRGTTQAPMVMVSVILGLILSLLVLLNTVYQTGSKQTVIKTYSESTTSKNIAYRAITCLSTERFGVLDHKKLERIEEIAPSCIGFSENTFNLEIHDLDSDKTWLYSEQGFMYEKEGQIGYEEVAIEPYSISVSIQYSQNEVHKGELDVKAMLQTGV